MALLEPTRASLGSRPLEQLPLSSKNQRPGPVRCAHSTTLKRWANSVPCVDPLESSSLSTRQKILNLGNPLRHEQARRTFRTTRKDPINTTTNS